jgi:quercetin dioxygenase-like cupin family protein
MSLRAILEFALCLVLSLIGAAVEAAPAAPRAAPSGPPPPLFSELLPNLPGQRLRADRLTLGDASIPPHRHSGSVYIYVLEGAALLQIEGGPETIVRAGESFFEPAGALHALAKSAEPGVPAVALAISIGPDGEPGGTFE